MTGYPWLPAMLAGAIVAGPAAGQSLEQTYGQLCGTDAQQRTETCVALRKAMLEKLTGQDASGPATAPVPTVAAGQTVSPSTAVATGPEQVRRDGTVEALDPARWGLVAELLGRSFEVDAEGAKWLFQYSLKDGTVFERWYGLGSTAEHVREVSFSFEEGGLVRRLQSGTTQKGVIAADGSIRFGGFRYAQYARHGNGYLFSYRVGPDAVLTAVDAQTAERLLAERVEQIRAQQIAKNQARAESNQRWSAAVSGTLSALQAGAAVMDDLDAHQSQMQDSYERGLALGTAEYLQREAAAQGASRSPSSAEYEAAPAASSLQVVTAATNPAADSDASGSRPVAARPGQTQTREYFTWCQAHNGDGASSTARSGGPKSYLSYVFATRQPPGPLGIRFADAVAPGFKGGCHPGFATRAEAEASRDARAKQFPKNPPVSIQFDAE